MTSFMPLSLIVKQQLLNQHYEQLEQATFILDADMRYLSINAAYEKLTGYSEESLVGRYFGTFATELSDASESIILQNLAAHLEDNKGYSNIYKQSFTLPNQDNQNLEYPIVFRKLIIDAAVFFIGSISSSAISTVEETKSAYLLSDHSVSTDQNSTNAVEPNSATKKLILSQAISANQFEAYYQPKVRLDTGVIVGFEALVRWRHPTRGLLKPKDFIEDIIRYDLSFALFCQLSQKVAQLLSHWQNMGFSQHISINADAAEFSNPDFNNTVRRLLDNYAIKPFQLHIEMTESSLMPSGEDIEQRLIELKKLEICLALDDFGTGYASLSYLQQYPFDYIKVDKSFISELSSNQTQRAIVQAILDLAKALDMQAVAEGIETKQQYQILQEMGCAYGQGYWLSHPVDSETATQMLSGI